MEHCPKCNRTGMIYDRDIRDGEVCKFWRCVLCGHQNHCNGTQDKKLEILEYQKNVDKVTRINGMVKARIAPIAPETDVLEDSNREMLGDDADYFEASGIDDIGNK